MIPILPVLKATGPVIKNVTSGLGNVLLGTLFVAGTINIVDELGMKMKRRRHKRAAENAEIGAALRDHVEAEIQRRVDAGTLIRPNTDIDAEIQRRIDAGLLVRSNGPIPVPAA
jgi:hypothetical protein